MPPTAEKIRFQVGEFKIEAYRLDGKIMFIRQQMAEAIGLTSKSSAQSFCKKNESDFPPLVQAIAPDKGKIVQLSCLEAAMAYWNYQATKGRNAKESASALIEQLIEQPLTEREAEVLLDGATSNDAVEQLSLDFSLDANLATQKDLQLFESGIEMMASYLSQAGLDRVAIASWKLSQVAKKFPSLADAASEAQRLLAASDPLPADGMSVTELARRLSLELGEKITANSVNAALHALGFQEWMAPGSSLRRLTELGTSYGRSFFVSSMSNGWSGAQIRWFARVVPVLKEYFSAQVELSEFPAPVEYLNGNGVH